MTYFVTCSGGNDSIALVQYMIERNEPFTVVYNNTGWAHEAWEARMKRVELWVKSNGHNYIETKSVGMKNMIRKKGGFPKPASNMQFCTGILKEQPSLELYDKLDSKRDWDVVTGRRREESANRATLPEWGMNSSKHGGRDVWNPLYTHTESMRDKLLNKTPFEKLKTQSLECYPCINANKSSGVLSNLPEKRVKEIEDFELSLGKNGKGNPRTMFRPKRCGGAVGIRQVQEWAKGKRGWKADAVPQAYQNLPTILGGELLADEKEDNYSCDGGYCGN